LTFNGNRDIAESGRSRGGLLSYRKRRGFGRAGVNRYDETWSSRRARSKLLSFLLERLQLPANRSNLSLSGSFLALKNAFPCAIKAPKSPYR
jgi:hypothetical protein